MKKFFRGSTYMVMFLWWWNLVWIALSLLFYVQGSKWHAIWAVLFTFVWAFMEIIRKGGNYLHDEAQAKAVTVRADEEER